MSLGDRMAFIPLRHSVDVYTVGEPVVDRFGNERPGEGSWSPVKVAQWWVHKTEEKGDDSVLRLIDLLTVHIPPEDAPTPGGRVRLPDGSVWEVQGNAEDFEHGFHGWSPGLVVVHGKRVTG